MDKLGKADALLIIDAQIGLLRGNFDVSEPESVIANISSALEKARHCDANIIFVLHNGGTGGPLEPKTHGWQIVQELAPRENERTLEKETSDSFYNTGLAQVLQQMTVKTIAIAGCMTPFCVDTTSRSAVFRGFNVHLLSDCHTGPAVGDLSAAEVVRYHNAVLDDLGTDDAVISITNSQEILF